MRLSAAAQLLARKADSSAEWDHFDNRACSAANYAVALVPADAYHRATRARWLGERAFLGHGSVQAALDEWDTALSLDPDNAFLLAEAGRTALALGDRERGVRRLRHGLSLYPDFAPYSARLGTLALTEGRLEEARALLDTSLHLDWKNEKEDRARARATLAAVYFARRSYELARLEAARRRRCPAVGHAGFP